MKKQWTTGDSANTYGINIWGESFFTINSKGNVKIMPQGSKGPSLDLHKIITELKQQNINLPVLIRFSDIIHSRMNTLVGCFNKAIKEYNYKGKYQGVFPIKVNPQSDVIKDIIKSGDNHKFGLEVGSKPELLIAISLLNNFKRIIICNGFKDTEYIQTALLSLKAGMKIFIVVERLEELNIILKISKKLKVSPLIGFRIKLHTQGQGKWMDSSGFKSKFGLTNREIVQGIEMLKKHSCLKNLKLLHFHIGSQISSIHPIKLAIREATRIMTEMHNLGIKIDFIDVGGGLGVDYDGSGLSHSSTNYSTQEYVNDIVYNLQTICDETNTPHPHIISESGRFLVAPSSVLVFNIIDANLIENKSPYNIKITKNTHDFIKKLYEIYKDLKNNSYSESFNDLMEKKKDMHQLFIYGILNLKQVALAEKIYCVTASLLKQLTANNEEYEEIFESLTQELSDIYFANFSVFQSLPDSWALGHLFPIMPIHRLNEKPNRQAHLADLTCDSDGKITHFMNYTSWKNEKHLPVHSLKKNTPYYMAAFLTGAYQEILGDMHNLFGDTEVIHISIDKNGNYSLDHHIEGDSIYDMLKYVGYYKKDLLNNIQRKTEIAVLNGHLSREEAGSLLKNYSLSLNSSTYLSE